MQTFHPPVSFQFLLILILFFPDLRSNLLVKELRVILIVRQGRQIVKQQVFPDVRIRLIIDSFPHPAGRFRIFVFLQQHFARRRQYGFRNVSQAPLADAVKLPDPVNLIVKEFNPQSLGQRRRIHVQDGSALCKLSFTFHHAHAVITHPAQPPGQVCRRKHVPRLQGQTQCPERFRPAHPLRHRFRSGAQDPNLALGHGCQCFQPPPVALQASGCPGQVNLTARQAAAFARQLTHIIRSPGCFQVVVRHEQRLFSFFCRDTGNHRRQRLVNAGNRRCFPRRRLQQYL